MADVDGVVDGGVTPGAGETPVTFDEWMAAQDETVRGLLETHVAGLKNALKSEREQRGELQKALKDATKELEQGTAARGRLEELSGRLDGYEQQIAAYDVLQAAGVTNLKLAWIAAREAGAVDKNGNVALETLKAEFPELFNQKRVPAPGNAGAGTQAAAPSAGSTVDDLIRRKAGR